MYTEISHLLLKANETISVAESVTSGYLQFELSQMENASQFYKGGLTAFWPEEKIRFLQIDAGEAKRCDCVSENIAQTMALNIAKIFNTNWGIAVTGYATPVEESGHKIFSFFAISHNNKIVLSERIKLHPKTPARDVQTFYTDYILRSFQCELKKQSFPLKPSL